MLRLRHRALHGLFLACTICLSAGLSRADCTLPATDIYRKASHSVLRIVTLAVDPFDRNDRIGVTMGTGFLIDRQGTILTNYHVILNQKRLFAEMDGRAVGTTEFVAGDAMADLALLRAPSLAGRGDLEVLRLDTADAPTPGAPVYVVGHPGGGALSISAGIVSGTGVHLHPGLTDGASSFLQIDARVNPGHSGAPLFDGCGRVVGVVNMRDARFPGTGFAISADTANDVVHQLAGTGRVSRPWFGVSGRFIDENLLALLGLPIARGFLVETVEPGSDGEKAGLTGGTTAVSIMGRGAMLVGGDIIRSIGGAPLSGERDVTTAVAAFRPGQEVSVEYLRSGLLRKTTVRLTERPSLPQDLLALIDRANADTIDGPTP